jgi:hypothetical protein
MCSICYDDPDNKSFTTLSCGHKFHTDCIITWYNNSPNFTCPFCRDKITMPVLSNFIDKKGNMFYCFRINRKTVNINNDPISFINKNLLNIYSNPSCWASVNAKNNDYMLLPIYELPIAKYNNNIYISLYARLCILYSDIKNIKLKKIKTLNNIVYYDTDSDIIGLFNRKIFNICYEWVYDVMFDLKHKLEFVYHSVINTFIWDLVMVTIKNMNIEIEKNNFQAVITCSIYHTIKFVVNTTIKLDDVNYYTDGAYTIDSLKKYVDYQKNFIKNQIMFH